MNNKKRKGENSTLEIEYALLTGLQDKLTEAYNQLSALKDLTNVLQYAFNSINDDSMNFSISSLKVIEQQLWILEEKLCKGIETLETIISTDV